MRVEEIRKDLDLFLKRSFKGSEFRVFHNTNSIVGPHFLTIILLKGKIKELPGHPIQGLGFYLGKSFSSHYTSDEMDINTIRPVGLSRSSVMPDLLNMAMTITKHIIKTYPSSKPKKLYRFEVGGSYTSVDSLIAKPTKIEHKTAKRPKRRGVVEAIIGGF